MRSVIFMVLATLLVSVAAMSKAAAQDPTPGGDGGGEANPSITITKGAYEWNPTKTMVKPVFEGTVDKAQGYTYLLLQRNVNNVWKDTGFLNVLTVDATTGKGTWKIDNAALQLNVNSSFRVLMKKQQADANDAATTKIAEMNLLAIP